MNSSSKITHGKDTLVSELKAIVPIARFREAERPYLPDDGLLKAVMVSLRLGRPLLITGEPGTGKTQFAFWLAEKMTCAPEKFEAKSTSTEKDLC
jgi:MoxR-like ATPase